MSRTQILVVVLVSNCVLLSCPGGAGDATTSEREIGLSYATADEVPTPEPTLPNTTEPGDQPVPGAPFTGGPPPVSHSLAEFLPITGDENQCVECHAVDEKVDGEPTPIPLSHFVDLRHDPDTQSTELIGARYNCVLCHVSMGGNELLVGNDF
jgi:nitrate reductase cytochrome c-type subunit